MFISVIGFLKDVARQRFNEIDIAYGYTIARINGETKITL
jgi:hypothetical protein